MVSRVAPAVAMPLDAEEEEVTFTHTTIDTSPPQPYLQVLHVLHMLVYIIAIIYSDSVLFFKVYVHKVTLFLLL